MRTRSLVIGATIGFVVGLLVSISMTIADWRINPSGLFHNQHGTDWAIVFETAFSWFWPVSLTAFLLAVVIHAWVSGIQDR